MTDRGDDSGYNLRALGLAAALWPAQAATFQVFLVTDGRHHCRAEVRHDERTIVAAGAWGKGATAARESLMDCLQGPSPAAPWTYHAQRAQAAESACNWRQADQEWKHSEQAARMFGGADAAQTRGMLERGNGALGTQTWLDEHAEQERRSLAWYLTEAGAAASRGDQVLACSLYRQAWGEECRIWGQGGRASTDGVDLAIRMTRELETELALA